jgi:predicted AlkP superfamily pyrophosphatase or phosphodiesterase
VVGLTPDLLGPDTPRLAALARDGFTAPMAGVFPAVTCTAQASMLTGRRPSAHGIVANGWYFRDLAEVWFWRQSNRLVQGEKLWQRARAVVPGFTCAQLFWWYNMYAEVDLAVTPRPVYPADGRKIPALYSQPETLARELEAELGPFPFFEFWGPRAGLASSEWIAACARRVFDRHRPTLSLVYLPHLDYNLQRLGPDDPRVARDLRAVDRVAGELIAHVRAAGADVLVVSEYGIEAVDRCVHPNRVLREHGYLALRETLGWETIDFGASRAFAVADHQAAHVYVRDARDVEPVAALLGAVPGVAQALRGPERAEWGVDHERAGEVVLVAKRGSWFSYYYWLDDRRAPDFARTVDIHRKPGYDPLELFLDPGLRLPRLKIGWRLLQRRLGFRMLMDVIPLRPELVRGSHGRLPEDPRRGPVVIGSRRELAVPALPMTGLPELVLRHWTGG